MRDYTFWFMSNVLQLTLHAENEEQAWEKLQTAINTDFSGTQQGVLNLDGGANLSIVNIDDEHRWELDEGDHDDNRPAVAAQEEVIG